MFDSTEIGCMLAAGCAVVLLASQTKSRRQIYTYGESACMSAMKAVRTQKNNIQSFSSHVSAKQANLSQATPKSEAAPEPVGSELDGLFEPIDAAAIDKQLGEPSSVAAKSLTDFHKARNSMRKIMEPSMVGVASRQLGAKRPVLGRGPENMFHDDNVMPPITACQTVGLAMTEMQANAYESQHGQLPVEKEAKPDDMAFMDGLFGSVEPVVA